MSSVAEETASTPILNLEVPFPARRGLFRNQIAGFVFGLISTLGFFAAFRDSELPFPYLALSLLVMLPFAILVHELGHVLAGWSVGFHFNSIQVAWFSLVLEHGKLTLRVCREMPLAGYASIQVDRICRLHKRLMLFVAAGPAASIASVVITAALANALNWRTPWATPPAAVFAYVSLLLGIGSLVPIGVRGYWTDGARLAALLNSREKARRWFCISALAKSYQDGIAPRSWHTSWTKAATSIADGSSDEFSGHLLAYFSVSDRKQKEIAAAHLERCLELAGVISPTMRDTLAMEAAIFHAWFGDDTDKATRWLQRVKMGNRLPPLSRLRADIALECAKRNFRSANTHWGKGQSIIEGLPASKVRDLMVSSWTEWREEIRERQGTYGSAAAHN